MPASVNSIAEQKYSVPALDKGFDILEFLAEQQTPLLQSEIAKGIGRKPNDIYRVLVNLEARGYLHRDESSGRYQLSLKIYNLSRGISPIDKVRQAALPLMEDLAVTTGQACHLSMLYQSQAMVIVQAKSHSPVSINITEGAMFSTVSSTAGKVLLANSNPDVALMILKRDTLYLTMNQKQKMALSAQLEEVKQQGFLFTHTSHIEGIAEYCALIGEPEGQVIAALTFSVLPNVLNHTELNLLQNALKQTAKQITHQLIS
ncbi:IclR family transcriptional regulator [Shewanella japonica]|uniref:IclR family transcriptional regulator n=1 Tax=Shewanella japonica TaxID=93973 RepID=UPI00249427BC|nr:IclR family transcriptional regulator [Shewanella japonica]